MKLGTLLVGLLGIALLWGMDSCTADQTPTTAPSTVTAKPKKKATSTQPTTEQLQELNAYLATQPTTFPGNGLAQHDFLYCGEWDTRKPVQTIFLVRGGKIVWTYSIPT